jgi:hypothetical protein
LAPLFKEIEMNTNMNAVRAMLVAGTVVLATSAQGQNCSGGSDGGMDATGNQCSYFTSVATHAATPKMNPAPKANPAPRKIAATSQEGAAGRERSVVAANRAAQPGKGQEHASVAPRAVKVSETPGAN